MGMYTQLKLDVKLKYDDNLLNVLDFMSSFREHKNAETELVEQEEMTLNHPLFHTERWEWMMRSECVTYHGHIFPYLTIEYFDEEQREPYIHLICNFNIKNYTREIEHFLDYLCPFILNEDAFGTYEYEEWDCAKPLIKRDGRLYFVNVEEEVIG